MCVVCLSSPGGGLWAVQMLLVRDESEEPGTDGKWETVDRPDEPPTNLPLAGGGLAKVKTDACGVCGTDFHAFYGKQAFFEYPRVIGHELCVTILEVPDGVLNPQGVKAGDVCAVNIEAALEEGLVLVGGHGERT